ncbi:hypothetical protein [Reyranella sp.]|uniref:hypothetical protein n=1 Tax=Reyranella sp. TaxID=1929291 RepID=UPI00403585F1
MSAPKILAVTTLGLLAAACSSSTYETRTARTYAVTGSEQACLDYGFRAGTDSYNRCVSREASARAQGRMPVSYTVANLDADARNACYSYGLTPGTSMYDRCVGREVDARRYRDQATVTPVPAPAGPYSTTTYYTTPPAAPTYYGPTTTVSTTTYSTPMVAPQPTPPAGVEAFRDEYGFRYDGQGNRLDRNGNIISPQSTTR